VDTKYFINKDLFVCLKLLSTSRYKTCAVITMSFAMTLLCPLVTAAAKLSCEEEKENVTWCWPWDGDGGCIHVLSFTDCHSKRDCDRKLSYAQFEGDGGM
jgi:hypothetical protein